MNVRMLCLAPENHPTFLRYLYIIFNKLVEKLKREVSLRLSSRVSACRGSCIHLPGYDLITLSYTVTCQLPTNRTRTLQMSDRPLICITFQLIFCIIGSPTTTPNLLSWSRVKNNLENSKQWLLRTFPLIVSSHPYCARKITCHRHASSARAKY